MWTRTNSKDRPRRHTRLVFAPLVTPYGKLTASSGYQKSTSTADTPQMVERPQQDVTIHEGHDSAETTEAERTMSKPESRRVMGSLP
jgi:hypothetical protein